MAGSLEVQCSPSGSCRKEKFEEGGVPAFLGKNCVDPWGRGLLKPETLLMALRQGELVPQPHATTCSM